MRLRLPELLEEHDTTAYRLAKESDGQISLAAVYRLVKAKGRARYLDANLAEAICRVLEISPAELFELDGYRAAKGEVEKPAKAHLRKGPPARRAR